MLGEAPYYDTQWTPQLMESVLGLALLTISATLFFAIMLFTLILPRKLDKEIVMPVAQPLDPTPAPRWLDTWWPWLNGAIALVILSYGPTDQRVFGRRQLHGLALAGDKTPRQVDLHVAIGEHRIGCGWLNVAQGNAQPRQQLDRAEWLGEVVVGGHSTRAAQAAQHLDPFHVRQVDIQHDHIRAMERGLRQRGLAAVSFVHPVIVGFQADAQETR